MPFLELDNGPVNDGAHEPQQGVPPAVNKTPPQLDLVKCRCRCCGCSCVSSRSGIEQRSVGDPGPPESGGGDSYSGPHDNPGFSQDSPLDDGIAGQEGVERQSETVGMQQAPFIEALLERLELEQLQRRPSFAVEWPRSALQDMTRAGTPFSMINEPGSGQHSEQNSLSVSVCLGFAEPDMFLASIGALFNERGLFIREPLKLGFDEESCRNMRIGVEVGNGFGCGL